MAAFSSQLFAGVNISDRRGEEADRERDHYDVHHGKLQTKFRKPAAKAQRRSATLIRIKTAQKNPADDPRYVRLGA